MPKISIIIPMFNAADTITATLNSILNQTYTDYEVWIIDDGSKDHSIQLCKDFITKHGLETHWHLRTQPNAGPSTARNHGIQLSQGEYIAFLDADDEWLPTKLSLQTKLLDQFPQTALIATLTTNQPFTPNTLPPHRNISFRQLLFKNYFATSSIMIRRDLIASNQWHFDTQQKYSEDYKLWLTIAQHHSCILLCQPLTVYGAELPITARHGLSTKQWKMEKGELSNYTYLLKQHAITPLTYTLCILFSLAKYAKRRIFTMLSR